MAGIGDLFLSQQPQPAPQRIRPQSGLGNMAKLVALAREQPEAFNERLKLMAQMGIPAPPYRTAEDFINQMQEFYKTLTNVSQTPTQNRQSILPVPGAMPIMPIPQGKPNLFGGV